MAFASETDFMKIGDLKYYVSIIPNIKKTYLKLLAAINLSYVQLRGEMVFTIANPPQKCSLN